MSASLCECGLRILCCPRLLELLSQSRFHSFDPCKIIHDATYIWAYVDLVRYLSSEESSSLWIWNKHRFRIQSRCQKQQLIHLLHCRIDNCTVLRHMDILFRALLWRRRSPRHPVYILRQVLQRHLAWAYHRGGCGSRRRLPGGFAILSGWCFRLPREFR